MKDRLIKKVSTNNFWTLILRLNLWLFSSEAYTGVQSDAYQKKGLYKRFTFTFLIWQVSDQKKLRRREYAKHNCVAPSLTVGIESSGEIWETPLSRVLSASGFQRFIR